MSHIVVLGAGFAALKAVRQLRKRNHECRITVVAPSAVFHYLPSLIWIPNGLRKREDLIVDLKKFFSRHRVEFHAGQVLGLSEQGRVVHTSAGDIHNDGLIIATGGRFIKKLEGIEHAITPCEGIDAAEKIAQRLAGLKGGTIALGFAGNPNEPSAMRGGPIFEFLLGIDTLLRAQGRRELFDLVFFSPAPQPGNRLGPKAYQGLMDEMDRRGIKKHLGHKLIKFNAHEVCTEGGQFAADLIIFMPGMTGNTWFDATDLPRSAGGLVQANEFCQVSGWPCVYVAGDSGSFPGPDWMPKQAHMAELFAAAAVDNLLAELSGQMVQARYAIELMCIVDSGNRGTLVKRTENGAMVLPPLRVFHWIKRGFEWWYLRQFR